MKLNILFVEDNDNSLAENIRLVCTVIKSYGVEMSKVCFRAIDSGLKAYIEENRIDIAFLDIDVGNKDGIDLAIYIKQIQPYASIVFISSHGEYLARANEILPTGFLTKPCSYEKLRKLCFRIIMEKKGRIYSEEENTRVIELKENRQPFQIREKDILYIKKDGRRTIIVTNLKTYTVSNTISTIQNKLSSDFLIKISRDIIVNKKEVREINKGQMLMSNKEVLDIPTYSYLDIVKSIYTN